MDELVELRIVWGMLDLLDAIASPDLLCCRLCRRRIDKPVILGKNEHSYNICNDCYQAIKELVKS